MGGEGHNYVPDLEGIEFKCIDLMYKWLAVLKVYCNKYDWLFFHNQINLNVHLKCSVCPLEIEIINMYGVVKWIK